MEQITNFLQNYWITIVVMLWTLPWKGVALWKAANKKEKWWFTTFLVLNTLGIIEILYIFVFSKLKKQNINKITTSL